MYDAQDVARHNTSKSCWVVVDGLVYDTTRFDHPGGAQIFDRAGTDVSRAFHDVGHSSAAERRLGELLVGRLSAVEQDRAPDSAARRTRASARTRASTTPPKPSMQPLPKKARPGDVDTKAVFVSDSLEGWCDPASEDYDGLLVKRQRSGEWDGFARDVDEAIERFGDGNALVVQVAA